MVKKATQLTLLTVKYNSQNRNIKYRKYSYKKGRIR